MLLSLKRRYRGGLTGKVELSAGKQTFELTLGERVLDVKERPSSSPDLRVSGELPAFRAWLFAGASAKDLCKRGELSVSGSRELWQGLSSAFPPAVVPASRLK